MAKISQLYDSKFRNWLLLLVVSRQDLKAIAGYTLRALRQDGPLFQAQVDKVQPRGAPTRCKPTRPMAW